MPDSWLIPWKPIIGASPDDGRAVELRNEVGADHVLYGIAVRPIGHRIDCDDVLFELLDGSGRLAVVHLTFAAYPEPDPSFPFTELFADWPCFVKTRMEPDALGRDG